jgi:CheY-like chemotaxis protein/anti-sigma regulatory factor (Ser/Thr protein kinase)
MVDLILADDLTDGQREDLEIVQESSRLLMQLLNELLDVSKIEAGKLDLDPAPFDLRGAIEGVAGLFAARGLEKGIAVRWSVAPGVAEARIGDEVRVRQILSNLVGNAVKFALQGEVHLSVAPGDEPESLHFTVVDTGIGIPPEKQDLVFHAFTQADGSTSREFGGTGLGLTIAGQLSGLMGGDIWLESEAGKGTTFHVTISLPIAEGATSAEETPEAETGPATDQLHIVVAEENLVNIKVATRILERAGHRVTIAEDVQQAVDLAAMGPDVILMDLQMPVLDGIEATCAIRTLELATGKHVPIVAMTAHAMDSYRTDCQEAGMDGFLTKPINAADLIDEIERVTATPSTTAFDFAGTMARLADDEELLSEAAVAFVEDAGNLLEEMRRALAEEDGVALGRAGHALKGAAAIFGGDQLVGTARGLEDIAASGNLAPAEDAVWALETLTAQLLMELAPYISRFAA